MSFVKPLRHRTLSEIDPSDRGARLSQGQRKYSVGLLEEAWKLSQEVGPTEAARICGINYNSFKHFALVKRKELGQLGKPSSRIPVQTKIACFNEYRRLLAGGFSKSKRECWLEAGRRTGVSGRTVEFQYVRGIFQP